MTDRERLIELCDTMTKMCRLSACGFCKYKFSKPHCVSEMIADCLLENGVIVPHVKVGDTVYIKNEPHKVLYMLIENEISYCARFDCDEQCSECSFAQKTAFNEFIMCKGEEYPEFKASDIGKTVFLNKEEAEKALKEREENA